MANKNIIISRVINVTGMIGVLAGTVLFTFALVSILFRVASALIFQTRFTGFGRWIAMPSGC
jgi:hypothetical protein